MQSIRVKPTKSSSIIFVLYFGKHSSEKHLVAVAFMNEYVPPLLGYLLQRLDSCLVDVDKMIFGKWRAYIQSIKRRTGHKLFR